MTTQTTLLKRSDGQCYNLHVGVDCAGATVMLSACQAFVVEPILSIPSVLPCQPALMDPCVPLLNGWFYAPTDEEAALVLLRARPSVTTGTTAGMDTVPTCSSTCSITPSVCEDCAMDAEEEHHATPTTPTHAVANTSGDPRLWDYVTSCESKEASKAVDVRSALVARFGKADATLLLKGCTTTVANNARGQSRRTLKAPTGEAIMWKS